MSDESAKVVTCPTCFSKEHTLLVKSTEPFEIQPWCQACDEPLGPSLRPTTENFSWIDHNNRN